MCFYAEKGVFTAYSGMICAWKIIVWQIFQAIQILQISSTYVEFNMNKTICVLKSVRPLEFDSWCMWRQCSISQRSPWIFGSLICN